MDEKIKDGVEYMQETKDSWKWPGKIGKYCKRTLRNIDLII